MFKPYHTARIAELQPGDDLETIAERERAAGNDITAADIARYNWGTDDPERIQELLRDELGAIERAEPHAFVLSPADPARSRLRIPEPLRLDGLPTDRTYQVQIQRKQCPRQFLACAGLPTVGFDFDSSFLRPEAKAHLVSVQQIAETYADAKLFVFGHTDAVGDELYNKRLSERRAWCVYAFLTKDTEAWETLYQHGDDHWGLPAIREMLTHLGHEVTSQSSWLDEPTRAAMRSFLGLPDHASVQNDAAFRSQLFSAYMNGPDDAAVPAERFCGHGFMGCGEYNLAEATDSASATNRRVTVFAFHGDRLPSFPCAFADIAPCRERGSPAHARYNPGFSCSFYDTVAEPCAAENERHSMSLLLRRYPVDSKMVTRLLHEYRVHTPCGKLGAGKASIVATRDETWVELRWPDIRAHMRVTLVQVRGPGTRVLVSDVPYPELHEEGHVAQDEATDPGAPEPVLGEVIDPRLAQPDTDTGRLEAAPWEDEY